MTIIQKLKKKKKKKKVEEKKRVLKYARKLSDARNSIVDLFEKGIFPYKDNGFKTKEKEELKEELDKNKFFNYIENESEVVNYELFEKYFSNVVPTALAKKLFETKDKNKNNIFVNVINSGLHDLKSEIKKMSKGEIEIEKPDKILKIVQEILSFNKKIQKESGGKGLKILTPDQMLSRLSIT